ncbi:hypothetical protein WMF38_32245 [Sorangium sp. So ce118]
MSLVEPASGSSDARPRAYLWYRLNPLNLGLYEPQPINAFVVVEAVCVPPDPRTVTLGLLSPRCDFILDGQSPRRGQLRRPPRTPNRHRCIHECLNLGMEGAVQQDRRA